MYALYLVKLKQQKTSDYFMLCVLSKQLFLIFTVSYSTFLFSCSFFIFKRNSNRNLFLSHRFSSYINHSVLTFNFNM